ncbi:MAG: glycoside hydrolase family 88 protein [Chitinophagaceae bacterium]
MKKMILVTTVLFLAVASMAQPAPNNDEEVIRKVADNILQTALFEFEGVYNKETYKKAADVPDTVSVRIKSPYGGWGYTNGVLNMAMINLSDYLNDPKYTNYSQQQVAFAFDNYKVFEERYKKSVAGNPNPTTGAIRRFPFSALFVMRELDDCGAMGASVMDVYEKVKRPEYREYIDKAAKHITQIQDRLKDGTLARKNPNPLTIWADDLYMSVPFLSRMGKLTGDRKYFDDAVKQVLSFSNYLWDAEKSLYYHCYFDDLKRTGVAFWGRCNGWMMIAQLHLLSFLPENHPQRNAILKNLERQILGIAKYQNADGLWHQVLDKSDSYLESSCTAMFVYAIAKAVNKGWIDKRYISIALTGWNGLKAQKITPDGQLKDVCVGTGIANDIGFYYNRPARLNDSHGLGPVLDAGIEVMKYKKAASR